LISTQNEPKNATTKLIVSTDPREEEEREQSDRQKLRERQRQRVEDSLELTQSREPKTVKEQFARLDSCTTQNTYLTHNIPHIIDAIYCIP
jgi:hypothetical protein